MQPRVYEAAKSGKLDRLKAIILENGEDPFHQTTPKENNILHIAAQYNQVDFIESLLQCPSGPSPLWQGIAGNCRAVQIFINLAKAGNYRGDTPLHLAAKAGSLRAVQAFINLAKSPHWVVENGQVDACEELLQKQNSHEDTALHYGIRGGHLEVAKLLIEVDPQLCNITNVADESPLYMAAERGVLDSIDPSSSALSSSYKGPKGLTAMHATMFNPLGWQKILEKSPEIIGEGDDAGLTPLHYLAFFGKVKEVQLLLQYDTTVAYDLDEEGQSALHIAAFQGHVNVIAELVKRCPDACDIINSKEQTALHAAVLGGRGNVVRYILRMPSLENLINEQDINGNTALHLAAHRKQYNIIYKLARDKRVDRSLKNEEHFTALDIFSAHEEFGFRAAKVEYMLKGSNGLPWDQYCVQCTKKWLDKQFVDGHPAMSITTESNNANRESVDSSKGNVIDLQLLAAVLIATVTFTATFTMPGGYNDDGSTQGLATLAGRAAFQAFVIANTTAFGFSTLVIFLLFETAWVGGSVVQFRYAKKAALCIVIAIYGMVVAFVCGTYVVLTRTIGVGIFPLVLTGCVVTGCWIGCFLDPDVRVWPLPLSFQRYVRNLMFDCRIP